MILMKNKLRTFFARLVDEAQGLTAVEYAVLGGGIVAVVVTAANSLGTRIASGLGSIL